MVGFNGQLEVYMQKFQDPTQSDAMSRLQSDLDDTKIVLVRFFVCYGQHLILN